MDTAHPNLKQFKAKIDNQQMTLADETAFDKWRSNARKCEPGSELKKAADAIWNEYQAKGGLPACRFAPVSAPVARRQEGRGRDPRGRQAPLMRAETNNASGAEPSLLGEAFHNPYTSIPFPPPDWFKDERKRRPPTPLTMDEIEGDRFTGIVELEIKTLSPLLTCHPEPSSVDQQTKHRKYRALVSGNDVIVPATGVRGSLRTLMTILAGGTLGYLDRNTWLVQGRDLKLGPKGQRSPPAVPENCFLAEVVRPGTETREGVLRLGDTTLVALETLDALFRRHNRLLPRPKAGQSVNYIWLDDAVQSIADRRDATHTWKLKLSGKPIMTRGKREGLFRATKTELVVSPPLWAAYLGRHRHGDHPELKAGDLVWLMPANPGTAAITEEQDIESIQWARWGKQGENLLDVIRKHHAHMLPDCLNPDGLVDEITDLFGQVPLTDKAAGPFAARIRPDNLVFKDTAQTGLEKIVALAPLAQPHPGCSAFYRANPDPDTIRNNGALRGFKVYRTTAERGDKAPWKFSVQGVYAEDGRSMPTRHAMNKTCDLLSEGQTGTLRLACRSLSKRELALLLLACSVDWRLGGGKPLGLGLCRTTRVVVRDEHGKELCNMNRTGDEPATLPEDYAACVKDLTGRLAIWHAVQTPVASLRYPRAASANRNRIQRGGHVWFQRHACPSKSGRDEEPAGLQVLWTDGDLKRTAGGKDHLRAQGLPVFNPAEPQSDVLYGYDLFAGDTAEWAWKSQNNQTHYKNLEPFDPSRHATGQEQAGGPQGQNRERRQADRRDARQGKKGLQP